MTSVDLLDSDLERAVDWHVRFMEEGRAKGEEWSAYQYFSASDIEKGVRLRVAERIEGKPWDHYGYNEMSMTAVRILMFKKGYTLLDAVREYLGKLVRRGELRADQPSDKRTCSGLRFRPSSWLLTDTEQKTKELPQEERNRRRRIYHYDPELKTDYSLGLNAKKPSVNGPWCLCNRTKRSAAFGCYQRKGIHSTRIPEQVTCKKCLAFMARHSEATNAVKSLVDAAAGNDDRRQMTP